MQNRSGTRHLRPRAGDHGEAGAVGGVEAGVGPAPRRDAADRRPRTGPRPGLPLLEAHPVDDADLVAVLQVAADTRQVDAHRDAELLEFRARSDAREHQELGRVERAAGQDHLASRAGLAALAGVGARVRVGAVEPRTLQILDADRPVGRSNRTRVASASSSMQSRSGWRCGHVQQALAGADRDGRRVW